MHRATPLSRIAIWALVCVLLVSSLPAAAQEATPQATPVSVATAIAEATPDASPVASPVAEEGGVVDLDVLFIGAHPDDEAGGLSTYGQWNEFSDVQVGVITITRGEGGGNAVGTEEGPALGLLREDEERRAVSVANITNVYNLDQVDFYYNVSAELTAETWGYEDTLDQVVRVVRATQPEVIVTMNPAPTPGNHGHHQMAGRLAVDAYYQAADQDAFPDQLSDEGLGAWEASRIFRFGFNGESEPGPSCVDTYTEVEPTDTVFGVWSGTESEVNGVTWAQMEQEGRQTYASQGWATFPDAPTDPNELRCDYLTLLDSRTPFDPESTAPTAALEGAVLPAESGLPLGTQLSITTDTFNVTPGQPFEATIHGRSVETGEEPSLEFIVPDGWTVDEPEVADVEGGMTLAYTVTPPVNAAVGERMLLSAVLTTESGSGMTVEPVEVTAAVTGTLEPLPEVAYFREWVAQVGVPALDALIFPVFSMGTGETQEITVDVSNRSDEAASGTVDIQLPAGFEADAPSLEFAELGAGETEQVTFSITNTDAALATSNEGGEEGTYAFSITTTTDAGASSQDAGINLVPTTVVPRADTAPVVDGVISEGEYTGEELDLSRVWEGEPVDSPEDGSGAAYISYDDEGIYIAVQVTDEALGTVLPENDAKRHWRTDSVEIAIDPLGTAGNTSSTFKVGVFPTTEEGEPAAYRDADAFQGPIEETAPGMQVASEVTEPYTGYVLEVMIPYESLPADIDPANAAMNIFIYDSDTQDLTGQTRLGWSTWNGVQGDPYRWGITEFEGFEPADDARTEPEAPVMPLEAAQSVNSPQSIRQSANDGVGLGGHPLIPEGEGVSVDGVSVTDGLPSVQLSTASAGDLYIVHMIDDAVVAEERVTLAAGDTYEFASPATGGGEILISFIDENGRVQAIAEPVAP